MTDMTLTDTPVPAGRAVAWKTIAASLLGVTAAVALYWGYMAYTAFWAVMDLLRWLTH